MQPYSECPQVLRDFYRIMNLSRVNHGVRFRNIIWICGCFFGF